MRGMSAAEHEAISAHCVEALNGHYDQHVFDAMMWHDGCGFVARLEAHAAYRLEVKATTQASRPTHHSDPLGFHASLRALRR